jgi:hypothetical protein
MKGVQILTGKVGEPRDYLRLDAIKSVDFIGAGIPARHGSAGLGKSNYGDRVYRWLDLRRYTE